MTHLLNTKLHRREREPLPFWQALLINILLSLLIWGILVGGACLLYRLAP